MTGHLISSPDEPVNSCNISDTMQFVLLLCLCVASVFSQIPKPCESPHIMEANVFRLDRRRRDSVRAKLSYDEINRRIRFVDEVVTGRTRNFYDSLYLHNVGRQYHMDLKTRICNASALPGPFRPFAVPEDASFDGEAYIGGSVETEGVLCQFWSGNFTSGGQYFIGRTYPSCIPVDDFFFSDMRGQEITRFFDVTLGISDPNVFIPPPECPP